MAKPVGAPKPLDHYPELLTVDEVAEYTRKAAATIYEAIRRDLLPARRIGVRSIRVPRAALADFVASGPIDNAAGAAEVDAS